MTQLGNDMGGFRPKSAQGLVPCIPRKDMLGVMFVWGTTGKGHKSRKVWKHKSSVIQEKFFFLFEFRLGDQRNIYSGVAMWVGLLFGTLSEGEDLIPLAKPHLFFNL